MPIIRTAAIEKKDSRVLAVVSRELVAAEAHYHRSCYRNYTRPVHTQVSGSSGTNDDGYAYIESQGYVQLFE